MNSPLKFAFYLVGLILLLLANNALAQDDQWAFLRGYLNETGEKNHVTGSHIRPSSREHLAGGVYKDSIWIYGGVTPGSLKSSEVWYYKISTNTWHYVESKGDNPVHTDLNNESSSAHPGGRNRAASAMDENGNLWFFGGASSEIQNRMLPSWNDLWKYNTHTNKWTWVGGANNNSPGNVNGNYNNPGVPDWPRARYRARAWFDTQGNYWIFGGIYDNLSGAPPYSLNDMWKFNIQTNSWTCETGDCNMLHTPDLNGTSGTFPLPPINTPSKNYKPSGRADYGFWRDNYGNVWIYGGVDGEVHSPYEAYGRYDTWRYNPSESTWTLLSNSDYFFSEPLCWLGNDGKPWMRTYNGSVEKFSDGQWKNVKHPDSGTAHWNNSGNYGIYDASNKPAEQFTTLNHLKTEDAVYMFGGYGRIAPDGADRTHYYMGALWKYGLAPAPPAPKIQITITKDDFDSAGASPYSTSEREILVTNIGDTDANNVEVSVMAWGDNSHSAMELSTFEVLDEDNNPVTITTPLHSEPLIIAGTANASACRFIPSDHKSIIAVKIPSLAIGQSVTLKVRVSHCMANFTEPTGYAYSWNHWAVGTIYNSETGESLGKWPEITNTPENTLDAYTWTSYQKSIPTVTEASRYFILEIGSGTETSPSNNQDLGAEFPDAQIKLFLTLPPNIYLENGSLTDITGEYATSIGLETVHPSIIDYEYTKPDLTQSYIMTFPKSRYLPIRRMTMKLRAINGSVNTGTIKTQVFTTFNSNYATLNYGWKTSTN